MKAITTILTTLAFATITSFAAEPAKDAATKAPDPAAARTPEKADTKPAATPTDKAAPEKAPDPAAARNPEKAATKSEAAAPEKGKQDPEKVFAKRDANGDGKLTKEEFSKGAAKDPTKAERAEKAFKAKDKDGNGELSKEEFVAQNPKKKKKNA